MPKIPLEDVISKIVEKAGITEQEVKDRIDKKLVQLSGLVSTEGAAHIVARELGINFFEQTTGRAKIKNIYAGTRDVEVAGKVMRVFEAKDFDTGTRRGTVGSLLLGDETGNIRVILWNEQTLQLKKTKEGDTVLIRGAYVRENNGRKELHMNDRSGLTVNPPGIIVGEVKPVAQAQPQAPTMRKRIKDIAEGDVNVEVLATVVQMYNPNFFEVCPNCGKRAVESTCPDHGRVTPTMAYVANAVLDDGTGNIRTAFYRQQLLRLLNVGEAELIKVRTAPETYDNIKKAIIPKVIKVIGRAKKNPLSNNLEFTANIVFTEFDVKKEVELLKAELK